jgi:hypothetical protein
MNLAFGSERDKLGLSGGFGAQSSPGSASHVGCFFNTVSSLIRIVPQIEG